MNFYPFCAVFLLYEHILACVDPDGCEDDLCSLERIGAEMKQATIDSTDFLPLSKTINALNKVSRKVQDSRRNPISMQTASTFSPPLEQNQPHQQLPPNLSLPSSTDILNPNPGSLGFSFPYFPDFGLNIDQDGNFQPLGFVRAVENDFIARNWHEEWWHMDGDINAEATNMSQG
jgi:hypothetical protein